MDERDIDIDGLANRLEGTRNDLAGEVPSHHMLDEIDWNFLVDELSKIGLDRCAACDMWFFTNGPVTLCEGCLTP